MENRNLRGEISSSFSLFMGAKGLEYLGQESEVLRTSACSEHVCPFLRDVSALGTYVERERERER